MNMQCFSSFKILWVKALLTVLAIAYQSITIQAATIYAVATGNWNNASNWSSGTIPGSSDDVIITEPYTITVTDSRSAKSVTIQNADDLSLTILSIASGGTLSVSQNLNITSSMESATARLDVTGTITIGGNIVFTSEMATDARIRMLNGGSLTLQGTIEGISNGNITSAAGSVSTFTFAGSGSQTIPMGTGYSYHNLVINKSGTDAATINAAITSTKVRENLTVSSGRFSNGGYSITGASGKTFTVQNGGVFILSGSTSFPSTYTLDFQNGSTIVYEGTHTIVNPSGTSFKNVTIQGSGTKTLGENITIHGNLTITGGTLDVSSTPYNIDIKGNWNNTGGTFNARTGTVTFSGSSAQTISTNGQNFYSVVFNNSAAGTSAITLQSDVTITNTCTMTDGIISTGNYKLILSSTTAGNLTGYSSDCYVNGTLRRYITNNTATYYFPVGSDAYQLVAIKNNNMTTTTYLDAKFGPLQNHRNEDLNACDGSLCYQSLSNVGMWTIDANANPGSGSYDIYAYIANMSGIVDNEFAVVKRPTGSTSGADWQAEAAGSINPTNGDGRLVSHGYALRKSLTSFSEFAIARKQSASSLPIQLLEFKVEKTITGKVNIKWTTATEINNAFFTVERSHNGIHFEILDIIQGAGNSASTLHYKTTDPNPMRGINYYRLKQTDFDGKFTYSNIVSLHYQENTSLPSVFKVFPNPVARGNMLRLQAPDNLPSDTKYDVELYNLFTGQKLWLIQSGSENEDIPVDYHVAPGIYLMSIRGNDTVYQQKIVIH
jgi:hypothetical protein